MTTTFQAIVQAIISSFTEILPLGAEAHRFLLSDVLEWPTADLKLILALQIGLVIGLFFHFRNDVASMISGTLSVLLYRRRPTAMDEKMPFVVIVGIILISALALTRAWMRYQNIHSIGGQTPSEWWILTSIGSAIFLIAGGALGLFLENWSRKTKALHHWSWVDAGSVGAGLTLGLIPGIGISNAGILSGLARNHRRDSATSYMLYCLFLFTVVELILKFTLLKDEIHMSPLSGLSFGIAVGVSTLTAIFSVQILQKVALNQFRWYWIYRILIGTSWIAYLLLIKKTG